ncbi:MAG: hypothetical protein J6N15_03530 [Ruminiclostridium sp.]|nr:hypothetical protein [Ruminiclostridium sp.]
MAYSDTLNSIGKNNSVNTSYNAGSDERRTEGGTGFGSVFLDTVGGKEETRVSTETGVNGFSAGADISRLSAMSQMKVGAFDADFGFEDETEEMDDMISLDESEELDRIIDVEAENKPVQSGEDYYVDINMLPDIDIEDIG